MNNSREHVFTLMRRKDKNTTSLYVSRQCIFLLHSCTLTVNNIILRQRSHILLYLRLVRCQHRRLQRRNLLRMMILIGLRKSKRRRLWVHHTNQMRRQRRNFDNLFQELRRDKSLFTKVTSPHTTVLHNHFIAICDFTKSIKRNSYLH